MRPLVKRSHGRCEWLLAGAAFVEPWAGALALKLGCFVNGAAVRAHRTIGPAQFLEMGAGGAFVGECLVGEVASHGQILHSGHESPASNPVCQVHNSPN